MGPCNSTNNNVDKRHNINFHEGNKKVFKKYPGDKNKIETKQEFNQNNENNNANSPHLAINRNDSQTVVPKKESSKSKKSTKTFLPHVYNSFSMEEINLYKKVIEIKKANIKFSKSILNIEDFKYCLADHSPLGNEEYKKLLLTWKLFKWITENIKFENVIIRDDDYETFRAETTLANKTGSSYSITNFYHKILELCGVKSKVISGYLKGSSYKKGTELRHVNHEWNAVFLYGSYRLVDCSSACQNSPYYDVIQSNEFFFCTPPQHFIYSHFPVHIEDTFLPQGIGLLDLNTFQRMPLFKAFYFIYGFQLFDYKNAEIDFKEIWQRSSSEFYLNEINFTFCLPEGIEPNLNLKNNFTDLYDEENSNLNKLIYIRKRNFNKEKENSLISPVDYYFIYEDFLKGKENHENILDLLDDFRVYEVSIRLPKRCNYELEVRASKPENIVQTEGNKISYFCFSYDIMADIETFKELNPKDIYYPLTSEIFLNKNCIIIEPLFYNLNSYFDRKKNINFSVRIPNSISAAIFYDEQDEFVLMNKKEENLWVYSHPIEKTFKNLVIAASFDNTMQFSVLVTYRLN